MLTFLYYCLQIQVQTLAQIQSRSSSRSRPRSTQFNKTLCIYLMTNYKSNKHISDVLQVRLVACACCMNATSVILSLRFRKCQIYTIGLVPTLYSHTDQFGVSGPGPGCCDLERVIILNTTLVLRIPDLAWIFSDALQICMKDI